MQGFIHFTTINIGRNVSYHNPTRIYSRSKVARQQTVEQSHLNLLVRKVERINIYLLFVVLDGEIATLIQQRSERCHSFRCSVKGGSLSPHSPQLRWQHMKLPHFFNQISRRTGSKPISLQLAISKAIEQAVRIEDIRRWPSEVITIIMVFEFLDSLLPAQFQMLGKSIDVITHLGQQFLLGDATDAGIRLVHAHILDVVQLAEDAELRKLRDARHKDKSKHRLVSLQRTIEVAHCVTELIEFFFFMRHIQQRSIIFINEHHHLLASLLENHFYQVIEPIIVSVTVIFYTILLFIIFQKVAQMLF